MSRSAPPSIASRTGLLLVNLGSPEAPTESALRAYLAQFLSDPLVVDWPRWLWWPILHGIILRVRPRKSAALYARVWSATGSPLVATTQAQARHLVDRLGPDVAVAVAMRYGKPSLQDGLGALRGAGVGRVLVLPLFPQETAATTGSVRAALAPALAKLGWDTEVEVLPGFHDDPGYVAAVAASVREADADFAADHLIVSFHGLPARRGRRYAGRCATTYHALLARLGRSERDTSLCFQSRFGPERWLTPATDRRAIELAPTHPRLLVVCPGFAADCLETLDEIGHELSRDFREAGGEELRLVPGLDERADWIDVLERLVRERLPR